MKSANRSTIADLARVAGVSISTVDRVLNGRDPVRSKTADKVLRAAEQIGFYATGILRQRTGADLPQQKLAFLLESETMPFYRQVANALRQSTISIAGPRSVARVEHLTDLTAQSFSHRMLRVGAEVDAIAVVAAEHPAITDAVEKLKEDGVPVFALISDLSTTSRAGFVGVDNWKVGRTAAWAISNLCHQPGRIALILGSHRYRCQETCEMGFRSYFREREPDFEMLEPRNTMEDPHLAYENTSDLLRRNPDLAGLFIAGGGIEGTIQALSESAMSQNLVTVARDLTPDLRTALIDDTLNLVISHPVERMARELVSAMVDRGSGFREVLLPFDVQTRENV